MPTDPFRFRWIMLGLIAWASVCLIAAGGFGADVRPVIKKLWMYAGLAGLVSAVGLSEVLKAEVRAQQQHFTALLSQARTDTLTSLGNRRFFDEELDRRWAEWERHGTLFSLLFVDVDHLKRLNDNHGHQIGDQVLQEVAGLLVDTSRQMDLIARYGGDEFALILPATSVTNSVIAAERLLAAVTNHEFILSSEEFQVTVSIGVAQIMPTDEDLERLVNRADLSLYAAKEARRNCGYFHDGTSSHPTATVFQQEQRFEAGLSGVAAG